MAIGAIILNVPGEDVHICKLWKLWKLAVDSSQFAFVDMHLDYLTSCIDGQLYPQNVYQDQAIGLSLTSETSPKGVLQSRGF